MSLWTCPKHGLYGGDVFCPKCGGTGSYATLEQPAGPTSMTQDAVRDAVENALLASNIAGETYGSKATRITNAVLTALDGDEVVERVAMAIEIERATIERDIPAHQRGQVVSDSRALARAALNAIIGEKPGD